MQFYPANIYLLKFNDGNTGYMCFRVRGPGPSPNLNLAATAHNLYLPALPTICIYRPRGLNLYLPALAN